MNDGIFKTFMQAELKANSVDIKNFVVKKTFAIKICNKRKPNVTLYEQT